MSEPQEPEPQPTHGVLAGVPVSSIKPDGSAGVRCYFHWTVGETTEQELCDTFQLMLEQAITTFRKTNGQVMN